MVFENEASLIVIYPDKGLPIGGELEAKRLAFLVFLVV
jgi:hypothetical protein